MRASIGTIILLVASPALGLNLSKRDLLASVNALQDSVNLVSCKISYGVQVAKAAIEGGGNVVPTCSTPASLAAATPAAPAAPVVAPIVDTAPAANVQFVTVVVTTTLPAVILPAVTLPGQVTTVMGATVTLPPVTLPPVTLPPVTFVSATTTTVTATTTAPVVGGGAVPPPPSTVTATSTTITTTTAAVATTTVTSTTTSTAPGSGPTNPCGGQTTGTISVSFKDTGMALGALVSAGTSPAGYVTTSSDISLSPMKFSLTAGVSSSGVAFKISITSGGKGNTYLGAFDQTQGGTAAVGGSGSTNYAWLQEMTLGANDAAGTYDKSTAAYNSNKGEAFVWKQTTGASCQLFAVWQNGATNGAASGTPTNPGFFYDTTQNYIGMADPSSDIFSKSTDTTYLVYLTFTPTPF